MAYKIAYLERHADTFRFLDPECHDVRVREINMRTKRCNRCKGFDDCKMFPHFWLYGEPVRFAENESLVETAEPEETTEEEQDDE